VCHAVSVDHPGDNPDDIIFDNIDDKPEGNAW
jgi:hypothetical protein